MKPSPSILAMTPQPQVLLGALLLAGLAACAGPASRGGSSGSPPPPATSANAPAAPVANTAIQGDANKRFQDALQLMHEHKSDEAQAALEALVKDFPNLSGPQTDLGIVYARAKQRDKAFNSFNKAIAANPKNATAYDWQGILYRESGDYAGAERAYLQALSAQPDYAGAHLNLAILYDVYLKRPQDAAAQYREYQRLAGANKPIVTAWINELQPPAVVPPSGAATSPAVVTPSSGRPAP
ncbi:MAG: tetratricopeptide repeat protein [Nevskia sp.]|nr:tetratricopeptide repeat protein [Nevskia sp.]